MILQSYFLSEKKALSPLAFFIFCLTWTSYKPTRLVWLKYHVFIYPGERLENKWLLQSINGNKSVSDPIMSKGSTVHFRNSLLPLWHVVLQSVVMNRHKSITKIASTVHRAGWFDWNILVNKNIFMILISKIIRLLTAM